MNLASLPQTVRRAIAWIELSSGRTSAHSAEGGRGRAVSIGGVELHVVEEGPVAGPVLLMLHGFGGSIAWFDRLVARLPDFRIVRVDLLGHGGSARPTSGYDPDSQGRLYSSLISVLDLSDVTLVGHSIGGLFGVATAENSRRVARLVVIGEGPDTSTGTMPPGEWMMHTPRVGPILYRLGPDFITDRVVRRAFASDFDVESAFIEPKQGLHDAGRLSYPAFTQSLRSRIPWTTHLGLDARISRVGIPALVIFGTEDRFYDVNASLERYRKYRTINTSTINHVGHSPMLEVPELTAELIQTFVSESNSPTRSAP